MLKRFVSQYVVKWLPSGRSFGGGRSESLCFTMLSNTFKTTMKLLNQRFDTVVTLVAHTVDLLHILRILYIYT